jgi:hypothetical protein
MDKMIYSAMLIVLVIGIMRPVDADMICSLSTIFVFLNAVLL